MTGRDILLLLIALFLDGIDYIGGFIPGVGDFIDIIGPLTLYFISKDPIMLGGMLELIPLADLIPTNIALAAYHVYHREYED